MSGLKGSPRREESAANYTKVPLGQCDALEIPLKDPKSWFGYGWRIQAQAI